MTTPLEDFRHRVAERQSDLAAAIEHGGLTRDPYRHVLEGFSETLDLLPELVALIEQAAAGGLTADLIRRLEAAAASGAEAGGQAGMRREAARLVRSADRRLSALVGVAIGAAFVAGYVAALVAIHFGGTP